MEEAETYRTTPMAQAAESTDTAAILRAHPHLEFRQGAYRYRITRAAGGSTYSVCDDHQTISVPIIWAFGKGEAGQTYIFRWQGAYYQSRVSFFNDIQGLDLTLGAQREEAGTLEHALGAVIEGAKARMCILCHTTEALSGGEFHPGIAVPGVHCEACHGPGANHLEAIQGGRTDQPAVFNPGKLSASGLNDFCGSCHRTWGDVRMMAIRDVRNVRFQPYRLESSNCWFWSQNDPRISCLACHDPHQLLVRTPKFYDAKCLACHQAKGAASNSHHQGPPCPVSNGNCVSCHMPKYSLPGGHFKFTDHDIRIVRAGAPYPG